MYYYNTKQTAYYLFISAILLTKGFYSIHLSKKQNIDKATFDSQPDNSQAIKNNVENNRNELKEQSFIQKENEKNPKTIIIHPKNNSRKNKFDVICKDNKKDIIRYCRKCGAELTNDSMFCRKCGTKIIE